MLLDLCSKMRAIHFPPKFELSVLTPTRFKVSLRNKKWSIVVAQLLT